MKQAYRLAAGGTIDRQQPVEFHFNAKAYSGYQGDTLASALLANGVHFVSRSFKFHRPRGIFTAGEEEPNALLEIGQGASREPSCRAPCVPLRDGLTAHSQSGWPSHAFDLGRIFDYTHRLWPAGFYNKTFTWPKWHTWEGMIRRMSGLGRPLDQPDPDHYEHVNAHCDVLICGAGPAGLMAALVAGRAGLRVIVADQDVQAGGVLNWERVALDGRAAAHWVDEVMTELQSLPAVMWLPATTVAGIYDHKVTTLLQRGSDTGWRECFWTVRPERIIVAAGAIEQGLVFPHNDRPGIMLAGAVRHYLNRYAVAAGRQVVIATNNDTAYQTALDLLDRGVRVGALVDTRAEPDEALRQLLSERGTECFPGARIATTRGTRRICRVAIESLSGKHLRRMACDLLAVSGGWAPRVHLLCHARGGVKFDQISQSFQPDRLPAGVQVVGAAAGLADLGEVLAQSANCAMELCRSLGKAAHHAHLPQVTQGVIESSRVGAPAWREGGARQWIDLAHDVTLDDARLAVREGYVAVEHFKRYTTAGMSVDQGKTGNINAFLALSRLTGRAMEEIGTTTFRPPYMPLSLGAVAGRSHGDLYAPRRYLPAHPVHRLMQARWGDYGGWQRPDAYPVGDETLHQALCREAHAVRTAVGVFDNSPIGKIEVRGPDAAEFLHRMYINNVHGLLPGNARYGLMLNENGVIMDDGVFMRLADHHFLVNTTSGGVSRVLAHFERWLQCEWRDLEVLVDEVTAQWANFTLAGPRCRALLQALHSDIDLSASAFPHMAVRCGTLGGETVRLARVSFSGELSFEVNLPASRASHFLARAMGAGKAFELVPYGIEALMLLRLEKGFLHVGSDTDGQTTPDDVGWGLVARNKPDDYIGRRSLFRPANQADGRKQLVGLLAIDPAQRIIAGGHLLLGKGRAAPALTDGWITSAAFSPTLGRHIALGVLRGGRALEGRRLTAVDGDQRYLLRVAALPFYDPANRRLQA